MKEYRSKTGGRYVFNEDIKNLQDLALSTTEMFKDCGIDFIINGCKIDVSERSVGGVYYYDISVTDGYAFINNKIRKIPAVKKTVNVIQTIGIYEVNSEGDQIMYADGSTDAQYDDYSGEVRINFENDNETPCILSEKKESSFVFPGIRTAFFKHYALVNNGNEGHYDDIPTFENGINIGGGLKIKSEDIISYIRKYFNGDYNDEDADDKSFKFSSGRTSDDVEWFVKISPRGIEVSGFDGGDITKITAKELKSTTLKGDCVESDTIKYVGGKEKVSVLDIIDFFVDLVENKKISIFGARNSDGNTGSIEIEGKTVNDDLRIVIDGPRDKDGDHDMLEITPRSISVTDRDFNKTSITGSGVSSEDGSFNFLRSKNNHLKSVDVENIINFFKELIENKSISIFGNKNEAGKQGRVKIDGDSVDELQVVVESSSDDDGDCDKTVVLPSGVKVYHDDESPTIVSGTSVSSRSGIFESLTSKDNMFLHVNVNDIVSFFNTRYVTRNITVKGSNGNDITLEFKNGVLLNVID